MLVRSIFAAALCGVSALATAGPAEEAAHARYRALLSQLESGSLTVAPRVERLIGWPGPDARGLNPGQRLERLLAVAWEWQMQVSPENATYTGFAGQNDRWTDYQPDNLEAIESLQRRTLALARELPRADLSPQDQLNLDLFIYQWASDVAGQPFREEWLPINQMFGVHTQLASVLGAMPLFTAAQVEDYLSRLDRIPAVLAQVQVMLERGLAAGITPPRITLAKVPAQVRGLAPERALQSPLLQPLGRIAPDVATRTDAQSRALTLYGRKLRPAIEALARYLEQEYLPQAREATAFTALPDGKDWYAWRVAEVTTTNLTPKQIHEIGKAEVARISKEMRKIMDGENFSGDIPGFVKHLSQDRRHYYVSEEALLTDYRAKAKLVDGRLPQLFRRFAALPYAIEPVPAYEAAGKPGAYYLPGSADNGRPGTFYVNTSRLAETPRFETEALLLHEAVPGHHFQIALAQEQQGLPAFRQHGRFTAYIEGWGLYAESLGSELGLYADPYSRFGALTFEIWRAIRLVVDTGMHALGWSRQEAIDYFYANTGRGKQRIEAEIDRYLVLPGQALAYKLGELKIKELRARASQQLGDKFDLREFHDLVLGAGALPLELLEQRVDLWIAASS